MKKFMMCFVGAALMLSLAACTPTTKKQNTTANSMENNMEEVETAAPGGAFDKVPDPTAESVDVISIYTGNEDATGLKKSMTEVKELDAQALVDKLIEEGVLSEGTKVLSFEVAGGSDEEEGGPGAEKEASSEASEKIGTLDLSEIPSSGTTGEELMLGALGNTFIENFELDKLKLLVNGENYSSGHIEHGDDDYLEYYSMK
ncbi:MAG: GerMN domain-containing protein [Clostridiaceae bacterium]|nr:GerMN domain-containing protein [Clostridiaceae bacterium]